MLAIDVGIAVVVLALTVAMVGARGLGTPDPATRPDDGLSALLAAAASIPLAVRRIAPLWVFAVTSVASLALLALNYGLDAPFGAIVAVYTVAEAYGGARGTVRRWAGMLGTAAFVPASVVLIGLVHGFRTGLAVPGLLVWVLMFAGAWVAGDRTRLRRGEIAALQERARRAEQEAERERRLAAAEERTRIARELHDSAGHAINVILVQAGAARLLHATDPDGSRQAVATIEEIARSTADDIDKIVRALRSDDAAEPAPADPSALEDLVARHRAAGLPVEAMLESPRRALPHSIAWATYRILQEALTNAARHGDGGADLRVQFADDAVEISVTNPAATVRPPDRGGHGIVGMRERATLLGGTLDVDRHNGSFHVRARLPHSGATS